jgi:predicted nuclease of restriction endonuclease-like (RecB) superfamily
VRNPQRQEQVLAPMAADLAITGRLCVGPRTEFFVFFVSLVYTTRFMHISDFSEEADRELTIENLRLVNESPAVITSICRNDRETHRAMTPAPTHPDHPSFLAALKERILRARISAARAVNQELILLYWDIGRGIVEKQQTAGWGDAVVERLATDLQAEFPDTWGHHVELLKKVKTPAARRYYLRATARFGWTRNVLLNQIKVGAYERAVAGKKTHNFELALPEHLAEQADEMLKSSYSLEFLGIRRAVKERELEDRLISRLWQFFLELGYEFCFVGRHVLLLAAALTLAVAPTSASRAEAPRKPIRGEIVISRTDSPWESQQVQEPCVLPNPKDPSRLVMFYSGVPATNRNLCFIGKAWALKSAPFTWHQDPTNPVFSAGKEGWDRGSIRLDAVLYIAEEEAYYIY